MTPPDDVPRLVECLPPGTTVGTFCGKRYTASHTLFGAGRAHKVVAEELGGADYISLNLYLLSQGAQLFPCEMPAAKVIAFLRGFVPDNGA